MSASPWFDGGPVWITGGRGFLGSSLALRLLDQAPPGGRIYCIDDGTRDCFSALAPEPPEGIELIDGDVRQPERWAPHLPAPSVVVHCAALAGVSTYYKDPGAVLEVNGLGTARLIEALRPRWPRLFIHLSTSEVYGAEAAGVRETDPTPVGPVHDPRWSYSCSKLYGEHLVLAEARRGLPAVSVRPFNVYGEGQLGEGAVRNFAERAVRGEDLSVTGDGSARRSWLYVGDFLDALLALAATPQAWGRTFNVGNEATYVSTRELAEGVLRAAGTGAGIEWVPHPGQDVQNRWPRVDALREATGWSASTALDEGLERTVRWWAARVAG